MRVLWFTHIVPSPASTTLGLRGGPSGGWVEALAAALVVRPEVELGIAISVPGGKWRAIRAEGCTYYSVPVHRNCLRASGCDRESLLNLKRAVADFHPDLIHVHGTEYFHGLAARQLGNIPFVVSIQGLLSACAEQYYGGMRFFELLRYRSVRDWCLLDGLAEQKRRVARRAAVEHDVLLHSPAFMGRTAFDRAHVRQLNPGAQYFHVDELLRAPFYDKVWRPSGLGQHTIYAGSASYPLKGFHVLLKAAAILRREFPSLQVRVPAVDLGETSLVHRMRRTGYARYVRALITKLGLVDTVVPLGTLTPHQVAGELEAARVFVLPSMVENSSNSLAEALLVGTPAVAAFVGGIPSMVADGTTALCFPPGDHVSLAEQIRILFEDEALCVRLSGTGRRVAHERHCPARVVTQVFQAYSDIIRHAAD